MRAEWQRTHAELAELAPAWDRALAQGNPDNPFLLADFLQTWAQAFVPAGELRVLTLWEGEELVGGLPLYRARRLTGPRLAVLRPLGLGFANFTEPFFVGPESAFAAAGWAALRQLRGWSYLSLPLGRRPWWRGAAGLRWRESAPVTDARIAIAGGAAAYAATLQPRMQANLRRCRRRADERGGVELRRETEAAVVEEMIAFQLRHNGPERYPEDREVTPSRPAWAEFTRTLLRRLAAQGRLDAMGLRLGGELAAVGFGFRHGPGYKSLLASYDPRFRHCGPGLLFFYELIEWCWRRGEPYLDMYADGNAFEKRRWCNQFLPLHQVWVFAPTVVGRGLYHSHRLWNR
ncbi:MAG TPA: GNAT family N-acetyltransferase [Terriglobales bacterium]|nr:GNAT family N-acetyltransferase [Terriglobales bacterium]